MQLYCLQLTVAKPGLSSKLAPPKKEVKSAKGVESAAVRAFLEKREKDEQEMGKSSVFFPHMQYNSLPGFVFAEPDFRAACIFNVRLS